jgi:predicted DNA-binding protein
MSSLSHRTQLLLDEERHRRLEQEARRQGRSVASLIREAIDMRLGLGEEAKHRRDAAAWMLATSRPTDPEPPIETEEELIDPSGSDAT